MRTIVWNHQVDKESDFMEFQKTILNLRKMRDDFKVWIPRMKTSHKLSREYRWVIAGGYTSKKDYLSKLRSCCGGVSPKSLHSEVQGSVIEGNECGIPYLIFNDPVYKEINKNVKSIKKMSSVPVLVGFGIKSKKDVIDISKKTNADGVIIGSALIQKYFDLKMDFDKYIKNLKKFIKEVKV